MSPKILYISPGSDFSGYAHAAREYIRALDSLGANIVTRDVSYDGGRYKKTSRESELAARDTQNVDIVISQLTPNECEPKPGCFNILYFAWETDRLPAEWVSQINKMDMVMVPCEANVMAARISGVNIPIYKIPHTFDVEKYKKHEKPFDISNGISKFKFLSICQYSKKKGIDALLQAYFSEFTPYDDVMLILKTYISPNDGQNERNAILGLIEGTRKVLRLQQYPPIHLIHSVMDDGDISRLYKTSDCYVLPSRGEGWGIPHFDALGHGLPTIATNWGGPTEFITPECGWLVDYNMTPVCDMPHPFSYLYTAKEKWAEPHIDSLMHSMRSAYDLWRTRKKSEWSDMKLAAKLRAREFSYDKVGKQMYDVILSNYAQWRESNVS